MNLKKLKVKIIIFIMLWILTLLFVYYSRTGSFEGFWGRFILMFKHFTFSRKYLNLIDILKSLGITLTIIIVPIIMGIFIGGILAIKFKNIDLSWLSFFPEPFLFIILLIFSTKKYTLNIASNAKDVFLNIILIWIIVGIRIIGISNNYIKKSYSFYEDTIFNRLTELRNIKGIKKIWYVFVSTSLDSLSNFIYEVPLFMTYGAILEIKANIPGIAYLVYTLMDSSVIEFMAGTTIIFITSFVFIEFMYYLIDMRYKKEGVSL